MKREYTTWSHALDIVKHDKNYNMLVRLGTLWNVLSLDALVLSLRDKGITVNALVVITEHPVNGYLVDESCFVNDCYTFLFLPANEPDKDTVGSIFDFTILEYYRFLLRRRSSDESLMVATFNHTMPDIVLTASVEPYVERCVIPCQIEEGVGAYMGTYDKTYPSIRNIRGFGELRSFVRYIVFGRWIYRLLHPTYNSLTLHSGLFGLKVNQKILPYYRKIFEQRAKSSTFLFDWDLVSRSVIICTVGWRRDEIQAEEDISAIRRVCDYLHSKGLSLVLKTHPRDNYTERYAEELHCTLMKVQGLSMEGICSIAKPKAVISFSSTTLVNPKIFWDIPTYCIAELLDRSKIGDVYLDEIDSFKRTFGNIVTFVKNPHDILIK